MKSISKLLIANRGEIAVRIIKTCKKLGIESVVAVSDADKESLAAQLADRSVCIGSSAARDSYLKVDSLVAAALGTKADAIHPGYGFLSETPELAEMCKKVDLTFIGPSPKCLRQMGNKLFSREIAEKAGVQTIPGSAKIRNSAQATQLAQEIGLPVMLKAAAGGGGRGMTIVRDLEELNEVFDILSSEVKSAFGDGSLFVERYFPKARHIEVQILADCLGNVIHLGERDCSIQRRYQKVIEEAPSSALSGELRTTMCNAAVAIAKAVEYDNCGTVEFIYDEETADFYFLEMNTRIQVEHPITEQITGIDIIQEQIQSAALNRLSISQNDVEIKGHAIECRINAESSDGSFKPCPGRIQVWTPPIGQGIRVDSHCFTGYLIPPFYDSLIAKFIVTGNDRSEAVKRSQCFLDDFHVSGVETTIPFLKEILRHPDYIQGKVNTRWLEDVVLEKQRSSL